ncbi:MAG: hypothetical protein BWX54_01574 [Verrucomicrobia bacterium ADurb.Bin018]|nr:MAG: hypothetical protein BWX54_01574 [Verrucomicrobia bacterium ADurb.Bin018]
MDDGRLGREPHFGSRRADAPAKIGLLEVGEEGFIEQPDLVEDGSLDHEVGADNIFDGVGGLIGLGNHRAGFASALDAQDSGEGDPEHAAERGGETIGPLGGAAGVDEPPANGADGVSREEEIVEDAEGVFDELSIAVEQDDGIAPGHPDGLIVGGGEAEVLGVFNQPHIRKLLAHHGGATIVRGVIHNDNFVGDSAGVLADGFEACAEEFPRVPVDDDHTKLERWRIHLW